MTVFADGQTYQAPPEKRPTGTIIIVATPDERADTLALAGIDVASELPVDKSQATRYEVHNLYDYFSVRIPDADDSTAAPYQIEAYIDKEQLVILGAKGQLPSYFMQDFTTLCTEEKTPARVLFLLFASILSGDAAYLETIEDEIEVIEELALQKRPEDQTKELIRLRKKLLILKRYYEAFYDLLEDLEENQNDFFTGRHLQMFLLHKNRVNRLLQTVVSLRDYITQVREAYQNQLDISLNETMQIFTVITAVFMPLTLIVGWYGMNLRIPEMELAITYPIVCIASIAIVVGCLWVFKRKKWF